MARHIKSHLVLWFPGYPISMVYDVVTKYKELELAAIIEWDQELIFEHQVQ